MYNLASWVRTGDSEADELNALSQIMLLQKASEDAAKQPGVKPWTTKSRSQPEGGFSEQPPPSRQQKTHDAVDEFTEQIEARGYAVQRCEMWRREAEPLAFDKSDTVWEMVDPVRNPLFPLHANLTITCSQIFGQYINDRTSSA